MSLCAAIGFSSFAAAQEAPPSPTPTPRPGTLSEAAARITLNGEGAADAAGRIVITDANLAQLSEHGKVTVGGPADPRARTRTSNRTPSASVRARWRKRVLHQKRVIARLEQRRRAIEDRIDLIENLRVTARTLARLQEAQLDLRAVDEDIRRERLELGRLIREARSQGAEPGWFR